MVSHQISPATSGAEKEKGGAPEGARQGNISMLNVVQKAPLAQADISQFSAQSPNKRLAIWLENLVEKSKTKPVSQMVSLTPAMAEMLLGRNDKNRKVSARTVETYAHEIATGHWAFNGEPIIVSDSGELNDGQHRCLAVIEAQRPIDVILIVGIKRETRTTLDQGKTRTAGDYLSMEGMTNTNVLSAAANLAWQYRNRGMVVDGGSARATKSEVLDTVSENPGLIRSVGFVQTAAAKAVGGPTVLAAAHFILGTVNREDADYFIHSMMSGAGLKAGDPILYVRNRFVNERGALKTPAKIELIFKAWNAWKRREKVTKFLISGGVLPVLER